MKKYSKSERQAWIKGQIKQAEEVISNIQDGEKFKEYLKTMASFHGYSSNNVNMIYMQNPNATYVSGFNSWKKLGRSVIKGEHSIKILAPLIVNRDDEFTDSGMKFEGPTKKKIVGYRTTSVFDIAQTEGKELVKSESFIKSSLDLGLAQDKLYFDLMRKLNQGELTVNEKELTETAARGYFSPTENEIVVASQFETNMKLKTLVHEYAHSQLHGIGKEYEGMPRRFIESQAEAVAYVVMQWLGLDTGEYSFGYIATWAHSKNVMKEALDNIHKVANQTITIIEQLKPSQEKQIA